MKPKPELFIEVTKVNNESMMFMNHISFLERAIRFNKMNKLKMIAIFKIYPKHESKKDRR